MRLTHTHAAGRGFFYRHRFFVFLSVLFLPRLVSRRARSCALGCVCVRVCVVRVRACVCERVFFFHPLRTYMHTCSTEFLDHPPLQQRGTLKLEPKVVARLRTFLQVFHQHTDRRREFICELIRVAALSSTTRTARAASAEFLQPVRVACGTRACACICPGGHACVRASVRGYMQCERNCASRADDTTVPPT